VTVDYSPVSLGLVVVCLLFFWPAAVVLGIIAAVVSRKHRFTVHKSLRLVDGQWWVVSGELDDRGIGLKQHEVRPRDLR